MKLVVDANILFSFFRDNPVRSIIFNSDSFKLQLFSPSHSIEELKNNIPDLVKYSKLSVEKLSLIIEELSKLISIIPSSEYKEFEETAQKLSPHKSYKDTPYFALALKLNCGIWSNEPDFKKQSKIEVFNTKDLRELLEKEAEE